MDAAELASCIGPLHIVPFFRVPFGLSEKTRWLHVPDAAVVGSDWPELNYIRPALPHSDPTVPGEVSVEFLRNLLLEMGSLVIGVSLGGLVAAKLQEESRPDLRVICISSPTWVDGVKLRRADHRVALYSLADKVISDRIENWPRLAQAYEFPWLDHDTDKPLFGYQSDQL